MMKKTAKGIIKYISIKNKKILFQLENIFLIRNEKRVIKVRIESYKEKMRKNNNKRCCEMYFNQK